MWKLYDNYLYIFVITLDLKLIEMNTMINY